MSKIFLFFFHLLFTRRLARLSFGLGGGGVICIAAPPSGPARRGAFAPAAPPPGSASTAPRRAFDPAFCVTLQMALVSPQLRPAYPGCASVPSHYWPVGTSSCGEQDAGRRARGRGWTSEDSTAARHAFNQPKYKYIGENSR